jgi:hypothetical protein
MCYDNLEQSCVGALVHHKIPFMTYYIDSRAKYYNNMCVIDATQR